jgi:hypothetical protein
MHAVNAWALLFQFCLITLSPATLPTVQTLVSLSHHSLLPAFVSVSSDDFCFLNQAFFIVGCGQRYQTFATLSTIWRRYLRFGGMSYTVGKRWHPCLTFSGPTRLLVTDVLALTHRSTSQGISGPSLLNEINLI